MAKLDRLGWADGISFMSYGVRVGLRVNDPAILTSLLARLPPDTRRSAARIVNHLYSLSGFANGSNGRIRRFNLGYWNLTQFARTRSFEDFLDQFESHLQLTVAEYAPRHVFVHAGVVGWKGKAIVIPGTSFSGKSTLVAELLRAGATYYSDEYAVFDDRGRVHPFRKPLELRQNSVQTQSKIDLSELGGHSGTKPLAVGMILMTQFKDGARWRPRKLTAGRGVLQLLFNTVSARRNPQMAFETLERVASRAEVLKGVRGQASDVVPAVLKRLEENLKHTMR